MCSCVIVAIHALAGSRSDQTSDFPHSNLETFAKLFDSQVHPYFASEMSKNPLYLLVTFGRYVQSEKTTHKFSNVF